MFEQSKPSQVGLNSADGRLNKRQLAVTPQINLGEVPGQISCQIITGVRAMEELRPRIAGLLKHTGQEDDVTLAFSYFLKNNSRNYAPLIAMLWKDDRLVACLYAKERRFLGVRTGRVEFGDYFGEGCVIATEGFKVTALAQAVLCVLAIPRIYWVRVRMKVTDQNEIATFGGIFERTKLKTSLVQPMVRHILPLHETFDSFLATLGSHTRRNLRVYRRRVEQKGWTFVPRMNSAEVASALDHLIRNQGKHKSSAQYLHSCQAILSDVPGAFFAGVRNDKDEWVSVASGWLRNDVYFMLIQLNHNGYASDSVSTVMRSYLIENLISSGARAINFIGGCSELLGQFCVPQVCAHYLFKKRNSSSLIREAIAPQLRRLREVVNSKRNQ